MLPSLPLMKVADLTEFDSHTQHIRICGELVYLWREIDYSDKTRPWRYEVGIRHLAMRGACIIDIHTHNDNEDSIFSSYVLGDYVDTILRDRLLLRVN